MKSKVLKWRIRAGGEVVGRGDSFREAVCNCLNRFVSVSESDLEIQVKMVKNGSSFWLNVNDNHIERIFEKLEDEEAREQWRNPGVRRLM